MIVIVDYEIGNVGSIQNMLLKIGADSIVTNDLSKIRNAQKLILPGVGHFDYGMTKLAENDLIETLNNRVIDAGVPILGICLGMQLITKTSQEGNLDGLGWVDAKTVKFTPDSEAGFRVPHMGWNTLSETLDQSLFHNIAIDARFYFVHSYYVQCNILEQIAGRSKYGIEFDSALHKDNIFGVQFHPEKSHKYGMQVLQNFVNFES